MHAIGHAFLEADPARDKVYVIPAFMFNLLQALRSKGHHAFRARLRSVNYC